MNDFTASNGIPVKITEDGRLIVENADHTYPATIAAGEHVEALREFFRAEDDERLGRWRWPDNPDYVVYAWTADPPRRGVRGVTVLSEAIPRGYTVWEDNVDTLYGTSENEEARVLARKAARAYFDAHPEPKPWHDAKPGEGWLITLDGDSHQAAVVGNAGEFILRDGGFCRRDASWITAGRRLWPEVSE